MATDDKKSAQDKQAELEKEEYYPHSIVEEEIIIEGIIDEDDLEIDDLEDESLYISSMENTTLNDTSINQSPITDGPLEDASLDDAALEYIHSDKEDGINVTSKLHDSSNFDDSIDKDTDKKNKKPDYASGDGDKIEELDDKIVAETNELLKEKRAQKKNCGCHH